MNDLFFSNSFDILIDKLKTTLYGKPSLLSAQTVIVPNLEMKEKLLFSLSEDIRFEGVFGIQVLQKEELLQIFQYKNPLTTRLQVSFLIEELLKNELVEESFLLNIIGEDKGKRCVELSEKFAEIFMRYALFSPKFFENNNSFIEKVFCKVFNRLPFQGIDSNNISLGKKMNIHLFCCRYFPSVYTEIFEKISADVFHYLLSPTEFYWEDFLTDREEKKFLKTEVLRAHYTNKEEFKDQYLDKHPLLANFGVMKREYLKNLGSYDFPTDEYYIDNEPQTLLEHLRDDLFHLSKEKKILPRDDSFSIHKTSSKLEEVLCIKNLIDQEKEVSLRDIGIYAPDVDVYLPFIELVFGKDIKVFGRSLFADNSLKGSVLKGILDFFSLLEDGFIIRDFHKILFNSALQKRHDFSKEEIFRITRWFSKLHLNTKWDDKIFEKLIMGLSYHVEKEKFPFPYPLMGIEMGDFDLVEKICTLVQKIEQDLSFFEKEHVLEEWLEWFIEVEKFYFSEEVSYFSESIYRNFSLNSFVKTSFSAESFILRVKDSLKKKKVSQTSNRVNLPTFTSLKNNQPSSFKIVFVLGLNETFFSYKKDPLDPMDYRTYFPHQKDQDYAFFLELILLTERKMVFSFCQSTPEENPATLLQELLFYLDTTYLIDHQKPSEILITSPSSGFKKKEVDELESISKNIPSLTKTEEKKFLINDLSLLAKHPIKFFFKKTLGCDLERSLRGKIDATYSFTFDAKDKAFFKHILLVDGFEKAYAEFQKADLFPSSFLLEGIVPELKEEEKKIEDLFSRYKLSRERFYKIDLLNEKIPYKEDIISITGSFLVHDRGFILQEDKIDKILRIWPQILLYTLIEKRTEVPLFFIEENKSRTLTIENPLELLELYLDYYHEAIISPSPLVGPLAKCMLSQDVDSFEKKVEQLKSLNYSDPYRDLVFSQSSLEQTFNNWDERIKKTFGSLKKQCST